MVTIWHDMAARALGMSLRPGARPGAETLVAATEVGPVRLRAWRSPAAAADCPVHIHLPHTWFIGRADRADADFASALARALEGVVLLADIPRAPGQRFPVAPTQAQALVWWAMMAGRKQGWNGKRLTLSGRGTGANLALGACLDLPARMGLRPLGVAALSPVLDLTRAGGWRERIAVAAYLPDRPARRAPLASPLHAPQTSLAGVAPVLIAVTEDDPRRDEGETFAAMLRAAGREVRLAPVSGASAATDAAVAFLHDLLSRRG